MSISEYDDRDTPCYRSGAAARLAKMPVTTLRIWERRYTVIGPSKSPSGQRLYSERDVQRLALLKSLVEKGHAIGAIANLGYTQLLRLVPAASSDHASGSKNIVSTMRLVVVGKLLQQRFQAEGVELDAALLFDDLKTALQSPAPLPVDALLVHVASLQADAAQDALTLADRWAAHSLGVVYAFGTAGAADTLRIAGAHLFRENVGSANVTPILQELEQGRAQPLDETKAQRWGRAQRRYSDAALGSVARMSTTIACECPRHLADLIMQLSAFEDYSDNCSSRSASDTVLHRYLGDVSSRARAMFETALERVMREEGNQPAAVLEGASKTAG